MHIAPSHDTALPPRQVVGHYWPPRPLLSDLLPSEEATMVASARWGSGDAAEQIFDRHGQAVLDLACAILCDSELAEAVVVDIIAQACTQACDTRKSASLRHNLARLTYLRCVQQLPTTRESGLEHDGAATVMTWLTELARQQRAAIVLVVIGDHTYLDVARLLRLPPAQVLAMLCSCLRELHAADEGPSRDPAPLVRRRRGSGATLDSR